MDLNEETRSNMFRFYKFHPPGITLTFRLPQPFHPWIFTVENMVLENGTGDTVHEEILPQQCPEKIQVKDPTSIFQGLVEFDLGPVYHPSFGSINIKSSFPRLQPRHERPLVSEEDLNKLHTALMTWVRVHFDTTGKELYFSELALATTLFTVYVNPFPPLYSEEMDLALKFYFWLWYQDDELENAIENDIPFELMKAGTNQLSAILAGEYDQDTNSKTFQAVENNGFFKPLFSSLLDLHQKCGSIVPQYFERVGPMRFYLQRYFEAMRWYAVDRIDGRYSAESFKYWRRIIAYFDGIAEVVALIHGVTLPPEIARSPILARLLDVSNSFGGFVNDLVGMKKEFKNGQKDNLVVFKVLNKGIPLEKVVKEICTLMETELVDFLLLKKVILKEFDNEENLVRYLDILESLIDGHNRIYPESTRHRSAGCIKLVR